jgi:hypothetical protein
VPASGESASSWNASGRSLHHVGCCSAMCTVGLSVPPCKQQ